MKLFEIMFWVFFENNDRNESQYVYSSSASSSGAPTSPLGGAPGRPGHGAADQACQDAAAVTAAAACMLFYDYIYTYICIYTPQNYIW